jgi:hypothetical protein
VKVNVAITILVILGILGHIQAYREHSAQFICGTDFPILYAGGKLAFTSDLYSPEAVRRLQFQEVGCTSAAAAFIRLPFFAAFLWPFTLFSLNTAFAIYRVVVIAVQVAFIATFRRHWKWALLACVWSFPLAYDLDNGQDVSFLLLEVVAGLMLIQSKRPFAAGLVFALGASKFHLACFIPLLLLAKSRRATGGLLTGGFILLAISFAVAGWHWPADYFGALHNSRIDPSPLGLHNLRGLVHGNLPLETALAVTVAIAVWIVCQRAPTQVGLCAALLGGILISHHQTPCDLALLLPVGLLLGGLKQLGYIRYGALLLITPVMTLLQNTHIPDLVMLLFLYWLAFEAFRSGFRYLKDAETAHLQWTSSGSPASA